MKKRVITGILLLLVIVPLIAIDHLEYPRIGIAFLVLGVFLSMVASYEMMNMFYKKSPSLKNLRYIIPVFTGVLIYTVYLSTTRGLDIQNLTEANIVYHFLVVILFLAFVIFSMAVVIFTKDSTAFDFMSCIITLTYTGLIMGYVISIRYLEPIHAEEEIMHFRGGRSFGYLYTIVIATDVFAYLVGRKFGRHKLCPDISPKKTVEGAIGGLFAGSIAGVVAVFLFNIATPIDSKDIIIAIVSSFFLSMLLSFTVQIGDLVASKLKRTFEIKDFGNIFPGHGGVLDRFDSLIFSGAVYYIIVQVVQLFVIWGR